MSLNTAHLPADSGKASVHAAVRSMQAMVDGELADFVSVVHPQAVNREASAEPPAARVPGPAGFHATALWLRSSFSELVFAVHEIVAEGDLIVAHVTMSGRQTGDVAIYAENATVERVFPALGRGFAVSHTHWMRMRHGLVVEHWANRDDQGLAMQLGWIPPSPVYLLRCALATRKARHSAQKASG